MQKPILALHLRHFALQNTNGRALLDPVFGKNDFDNRPLHFLQSWNLAKDTGVHKFQSGPKPSHNAGVYFKFDIPRKYLPSVAVCARTLPKGRDSRRTHSVSGLWLLSKSFGQRHRQWRFALSNQQSGRFGDPVYKLLQQRARKKNCGGVSKSRRNVQGVLKTTILASNNHWLLPYFCNTIAPRIYPCCISICEQLNCSACSSDGCCFDSPPIFPSLAQSG